MQRLYQPSGVYCQTSSFLETLSMSQVRISAARLTVCAGFLVAALFSSGSSALANLEGLSTQEQALALVRHVEDLYRSSASRATLSMRIITPQYERTLVMHSESLGSRRAMIRILSPRRDRGIATLRVDREMWNYFPKIDKVIKVPPSMMLGSWMGSDFTNDDLVRETELADEYSLALRKNDLHYILVLTPRAETVTLWAKIEIEINRTTFLPERQTYFDDDQSPVRRLIFSDPRSFSGTILPARMEMQRLGKPGNRTLITYDALELRVQDISEKDFSLRALKQRRQP